MKKRILYYDVLNILAAFGVIMLHCNGRAHTFSNSLGWYQALLVEVVFYWPVPIFFMLSGATLMGYRERYTTKDFFKKRFLRTVIPFVVWTILNAIYKGINPFEIGFRTFINQCFNTSVEGVYWFFIPLFSVYLAMPVLSVLKEHRHILWYMVGGSFLLNSLLPPIFVYLKLQWNWNLAMLTVGGYLQYVILGYLLSTTELKKKYRLVIYGLGIFGVCLRYGMTVLLSLRDGVINKTFFSYTQYYAVFLAVAVFAFFKHFKPLEKLAQHPKIVSALKTISGCSFGIYLMHMIIYRELAKILPTACWQWRLLVPFLIYALALTVTLILKKIPVIKNIVP